MEVSVEETKYMFMSDQETLGQIDIINTKLASIFSENVAKFKYLEKKYNKLCLNSWGNSENVKFEEWLLPFGSGTSVFSLLSNNIKIEIPKCYNFASVL